jgi:hypothetical protein
VVLLPWAGPIFFLFFPGPVHRPFPHTRPPPRSCHWLGPLPSPHPLLLCVLPSSRAPTPFLFRPQFKMPPSASSLLLLPLQMKSGHLERTSPPPHSPLPFIQAASPEHRPSPQILAGNATFLPPPVSHCHIPFFK